MNRITEAACSGLALGRSAQYHPMMFRLPRSFRWFVAFAALCLAYAGPVAACVCAKGAPVDMPCCPDQHGSDQSNCQQPDSDAAAACDPAPAHVLASVSFDVSFPVANFAAASPLWSAHGPPPVPIPHRQSVHDCPPIYLVTLRLRN